MRYFITVYETPNARNIYGERCWDRRSANQLMRQAIGNGLRPLFRIHVRLKGEAA